MWCKRFQICTLLANQAQLKHWTNSLVGGSAGLELEVCCKPPFGMFWSGGGRWRSCCADAGSYRTCLISSKFCFPKTTYCHPATLPTFGLAKFPWKCHEIRSKDPILDPYFEPQFPSRRPPLWWVSEQLPPPPHRTDIHSMPRKYTWLVINSTFLRVFTLEFT